MKNVTSKPIIGFMIFLLLWKMVDSSDEEARTWTLAEHQKWQTHFCYDYEFFIKKSKREKSASEEYKKEFRVKNYLELHNLNFAMQEDLDNIDEWGLKCCTNRDEYGQYSICKQKDYEKASIAIIVFNSSERTMKGMFQFSLVVHILCLHCS